MEHPLLPGERFTIRFPWGAEVIVDRLKDGRYMETQYSLGCLSRKEITLEAAMNWWLHGQHFVTIEETAPVQAAEPRRSGPDLVSGFDCLG